MTDLFSASQTIDLPDAKLVYYPEFYSQADSQNLLTDLISSLTWSQPEINLYGRQLLVPRLVSWAGDDGLSYSYSGLKHFMTGWPVSLQLIRERVQQATRVSFNSVLLNYYRDGQDSMAWHSDDETELGQNPNIASLSFGQPRRFVFKHKRSGERYDIELGNGDLLLMAGATQHHWQHSLPKTQKTLAARVNLTFRMIK